MPFQKKAPLPTPADLSLPKDEKLVEATACRDSFSYFLANYTYILDPTKGKIKFELWPVHQELADFILSYDRIVILKARQVAVMWLLASYPHSTPFFKA